MIRPCLLKNVGFRYVGFFKGVQSAGGAAAWQIDAHKVSPINQLIVNWGLTSISYPLLAVLVMLAVTDSGSNSEEAVARKDAELVASEDSNPAVTKTVK